MILAGDIGGTKTELGCFRVEPYGLDLIHSASFVSRNYPGLKEIVQEFVGQCSEPIASACFGIAGPVQGDEVQTPNLPWVVRGSELAAALGLPRVTLLNDLEANAHGIAVLRPEDVVTLTDGIPGEPGNAALISAGTGLGEAGLHWDGKSWEPIVSEGGHVDFAPRSRLEAEMLGYLLQQYDHVSYERFLSGPGLVNIYRFLADSGRCEEPDSLRDKVTGSDCAAAIAEGAREGIPICKEAIEIFVAIYGAAAGNLALKVLAVSGVFLGGGIAPKMIPALQSPTFLEAFRSKGRMRPLMEKIPVRVILNPKTALLGAAHVASRPGQSAANDPIPPVASSG